MAEKMTYEQAVARLDEIVHSMEKGDAALEESLRRFEEGAVPIAPLGAGVDEAEQKVVKLKKGPDGEPIELSFEDEA